MDDWVPMLEYLDKQGLGPNKRGMTELARRSGISRNTVASWFNRPSTPDVTQAAKVAEKLGISLDFLITGREHWPELQNDQIRRVCRKLGGLSDDQLEAVERVVDAFARPDTRAERVAGEE